MKLFPVVASLLFLSACNNSTETPIETPKAQSNAGVAAPQAMQLNIIGIYAHDTSAYTQGLEIYDGKMYESTGDFENSSLRIIDVKTGKVIQKHMMGTAQVFGEGITIFQDRIYQLTWKNNVVNVYDVKNIDKPIQTFRWPYEGWGITHNDTDLIISDGTANLHFVNPADFKVKRSIQVRDNIGSVNALNELEFIDGYVFANIYGSDFIVKIDPSNGHVVGRVSLPGLIQQYAKGYVPGPEEVLNGIAWDSISKKLYITGKRWPKMFEALIN
jgi:glutamine cyclotransferase